MKAVLTTLASAALLTLLPLTLQSQAIDLATAGKLLTAKPADPRIAAALRQVSTSNIQATIARLVQFKNRSTVSSTETDLPAGIGVLAAADWIRSQFEQYSQACSGCLQVKVDAFTEPAGSGPRARIRQPTTIRNVYAILRGTDAAAAPRMYLVTGHYDTRVTDVMNTHSDAPGANDDSSGTAVSLEAARVLSKYKFPATLVFVAVAGEEQGLNGSHHLAALARQEGWLLQGVLNNDIVGGDTTPGDTLQDKQRVRVFSQGVSPSAPPDQLRQLLTLGLDNDSPSRELARAVLDVDRAYFPSIARGKSFKPVMELRLDRFLRGGDHKSFSDEGFPAIRFTEWRENFNHQHQDLRTENGTVYGDLLKFVDPAYVANVARLNMATLATLAMSPGEPTTVRIVTTNLDNNTTLTWEPPTQTSGAIRYEVLWRETAVSDWQYSADATGKEPKAGHPGMSITLPVSKDNVFFGVRACDSAGHCSPAVTPLPERP